MFTDEVQDPFGVEGGGEGAGHQPRLRRLEAGLAQQHFNVLVPEGNGGNLEPSAGGMSGRENQVAVLHHVGDPLGSEGDEPLKRRSARSQRRRTEEETALEGRLGVVEQCQHQACAAAEAAEDRTLANARVLRKPIHGERRRTPLLNQFPGSKQEPLTVPGSITALRGGHRRHSGAHWDGTHKASVATGNTNGPRSV